MRFQNDKATAPRILVAEDNPVNREVARHMLENLGCAVDAVADGQQALDACRARAYDLLLMDCDMPVLDGLEATRLIRAHEGARRRTRIIALTAATSDEERDKCHAAGMDDFLSKPLRPPALEGMLARWLPAGGTGEPAAPAAYAEELETVQQMFGEDFATLAALYLADSPPRVAAMRRDIAATDHAELARIAHALAGSSMSIGATGLSALCKELEERAKKGMPEDAAARLAVIDAEYRRICGRLRDMVRQER